MRSEKKNRVVEVIEYYIEHKQFPSGEELKEIAERHGVAVTTIKDDIRKAKDNHLGEKVVTILDTKMDKVIDGVAEMKDSDLIKLYQATRPKRTESKIDLKAEIDIRGESVMDTLKEFGDLIKREDIHKERNAES